MSGGLKNSPTGPFLSKGGGRVNILGVMATLLDMGS